MESIEFKKAILQKHLPLVEKTLAKMKGSKFEAKWNTVLMLITSNKQMTAAQINQLDQKLKSFSKTYFPQNDKTEQHEDSLEQPPELETVLIKYEQQNSTTIDTNEQNTSSIKGESESTAENKVESTDIKNLLSSINTSEDPDKALEAIGNILGNENLLKLQNLLLKGQKPVEPAKTSPVKVKSEVSKEQPNHKEAPEKPIVTKRPPKRKLNELEKLQLDISEMYDHEEVMRSSLQARTCAKKSDEKMTEIFKNEMSSHSYVQSKVIAKTKALEIKYKLKKLSINAVKLNLSWNDMPIFVNSTMNEAYINNHKVELKNRANTQIKVEPKQKKASPAVAAKKRPKNNWANGFIKKRKSKGTGEWVDIVKKPKKINYEMTMKLGKFTKYMRLVGKMLERKKMLEEDEDNDTEISEDEASSIESSKKTIELKRRQKSTNEIEADENLLDEIPSPNPPTLRTYSRSKPSSSRSSSNSAEPPCVKPSSSRSSSNSREPPKLITCSSVKPSSSISSTDSAEPPKLRTYSRLKPSSSRSSTDSTATTTSVKIEKEKDSSFGSIRVVPKVKLLASSQINEKLVADMNCQEKLTDDNEMDENLLDEIPSPEEPPKKLCKPSSSISSAEVPKIITSSVKPSSSRWSPKSPKIITCSSLKLSSSISSAEPTKIITCGTVKPSSSISSTGSATAILKPLLSRSSTDSTAATTTSVKIEKENDSSFGSIRVVPQAKLLASPHLSSPHEKPVTDMNCQEKLTDDNEMDENLLDELPSPEEPPRVKTPTKLSKPSTSRASMDSIATPSTNKTENVNNSSLGFIRVIPQARLMASPKTNNTFSNALSPVRKFIKLSVPNNPPRAFVKPLQSPSHLNFKRILPKIVQTFTIRNVSSVMAAAPAIPQSLETAVTDTTSLDSEPVIPKSEPEPETPLSSSTINMTELPQTTPEQVPSSSNQKIIIYPHKKEATVLPWSYCLPDPLGDLVIDQSQDNEEKMECEVVENNNIDILRPWLDEPNFKNTKKTSTCEKMLTKYCLASLYKCMGSRCCYFTNDRSLFQIHLETHAKLQSTEIRSTLICAYCSYLGISSINLMRHIQQEHRYDVLSCMHCFYRTHNEFQMYLNHYPKYHEGEAKVAIQLDNFLTKPPKSDLVYIKNTLSNHVAAFACIFPGCSKKFYVLEIYNDHLQSHKEKVSTKCLRCKVKTTPDNIFEHYFACYGFGMIQCVYCTFGTSTMQFIDDHLATKHPNRAPYFSERLLSSAVRSNPHLNLSSIETLTIKLMSKKIEGGMKIKISEKELLNHTSNVANLTDDEPNGKQPIPYVRNTPTLSLQIENVMSLHSDARQ